MNHDRLVISLASVIGGIGYGFCGWSWLYALSVCCLYVGYLFVVMRVAGVVRHE